MMWQAAVRTHLCQLILHLHHDRVHLCLGCVEAVDGLLRANDLACQRLGIAQVAALGGRLDGAFHLVLLALDA
jgi:hypothetical protein